MQNYKIEVSKNNKKYNIVLKAENELAARDRVHKEGYSILSIKEIGESENVGSTFIFEGYDTNGELKHGKIGGNDIFKAYVKLRKDLGYDIDYIYPESDEGISSERKQKIIEELREEFDLFYKNGKKKEAVQKTSRIDKDAQDLRNFYLNKELTETNKLVEKVLQKLNNIFAGTELKTLNSKKKEVLKQVYNEIIKLQKTTNIAKLKEIGELALSKIGELELEDLEKSKNSDDRKLLKETNRLLRDFGSKNQFIEKDKDIKYQAQSVLKTLGEMFKREKKETTRAIEMDKASYSYVKNLLYLNKYEARRSENTKFILKNIFKILTDKDLREDTLLARSVINQNIVLLKARQNGVQVSYTLLIKGIFKLFDAILGLFKSLEPAIFAIIFIYTLFVIIYWNLYIYIDLPEFIFGGLFSFIIIILFYLCIHLSKNLLMLILSFVILAFIIIFGVINF